MHRNRIMHKLHIALFLPPIPDPEMLVFEGELDEEDYILQLASKTNRAW
jgi:hypothetical protein